MEFAGKDSTSTGKDFAQLLQITVTFLTAAAAAALAGFNAEKQHETEAVLATVKARVEEVTPKEVEAYLTLWSAVARYYRALSSFEVGVYHAEEIADAEKRCNEADGLSLLIDDEHEEAFWEYWQTAVNLADSARDKGSDEVRKVWADGGAKELARLRKMIKTEFAARVRGKKKEN